MEGDREFKVVLPNGAVEVLRVWSHGAVFELKVTCESEFGIPTQLQEIHPAEVIQNNNETELQDLASLKDIEHKEVKIQVPICWNRIVCGVLNNEVENVYRRIQFPMQHISREERLFVALFMSCCRGQSDLLSRLVNLNREADLGTVTKSKRTLFHACALSGDMKCLEIVIKDLITSSFGCFNTLDVNNESALQIAKRLGHQNVANVLSEYATSFRENSESASYSTESGIALWAERSREINPPLPRQTQADSEDDVNNTRDFNEVAVTKNKQNRLTNENTDLRVIEKAVSGPSLGLEIVLDGCEQDIDGKEDATFYAHGNLTRQTPSCDSVKQLVSGSSDPVLTSKRSTSSLSSSSDDSDKLRCFSVSPIPQRPQDLALKPLLGRRRRQDEEKLGFSSSSARQAHVPDINVSDESSGDDEDRLPSVGEENNLTGHRVLERSCSLNEKARFPQGRCVQRRDFRSTSTPSSPVTTPRHSPSEEHSPHLGIKEILITKSAPNSPEVNRSRLVRTGAVIAHARIPIPPNSPIFRTTSNRRQSEPFAPAPYTGGKASVRLTRLRKGSLIAPQRPDSAMRDLIGQQRTKSRSICEATISDSFRSQWLNKTMESEERLERPWNAWIAAKRQDTLAPTPEERLTPVSPAPSPGVRRKSFQQWLSAKDMTEMRKLHAESQLEAQQFAQTLGKQVKGKSFEDWLQDKHEECQKEKEKEKEKEEEQKGHVEMRQRRRRMSQAKYQSWLQEKELKALEEEEKRLGEAKEKLEKMKVKWEEEDEIKKKKHVLISKRPVIRTQSCPTNNEPRNLSRQRFSSLQVHSK